MKTLAAGELEEEARSELVAVGLVRDHETEQGRSQRTSRPPNLTFTFIPMGQKEQQQKEETNLLTWVFIKKTLLTAIDCCPPSGHGSPVPNLLHSIILSSLLLSTPLLHKAQQWKLMSTHTTESEENLLLQLLQFFHLELLQPAVLLFMRRSTR